MHNYPKKRNPPTYLTPAAYDDIVSSTLTQADLARKYGITSQYMSKILARARRTGSGRPIYLGRHRPFASKVKEQIAEQAKEQVAEQPVVIDVPLSAGSIDRALLESIGAQLAEIRDALTKVEAREASSIKDLYEELLASRVEERSFFASWQRFMNILKLRIAGV